MLEQVKKMFREAKDTHHNLFTETVSLKEQLRGLKLADQVDTVYGLKKMEELLEDVRKEVSKLRRYAETMTCLTIFQEDEESFSTEYCSSRVKVKQFARYPHKRRQDPDAYDALMKDLGVPDELIESEALRVNYEGFINWFSKNQEEGQPLPQGIDPEGVYTEYTLTTRKRKDVDE